METVINGVSVDIQNGDIIVLGTGYSGIFIGGAIPKIVYTNYRGNPYNGWDRYYNIHTKIKLIFRYDQEHYNPFWDIIDVEEYLFKNPYGIFIYEKSNIVELTMDEIARKFGVDVNNLKIKK